MSFQVQIYPNGVLITLGSHIANLAGDISGGHFVDPTDYVYVIAGVTPTAATSQATGSSTGDIREVDLVTTSSGVQVQVHLRSPESSGSLAVGDGTDVQVSFA